ncbi:DUF305 domain-containing protein [Rhodococcus sp. ARC_M6]|uniref:DUF305 domain-containing protein n=1 Tax=Rhodococcus sp. ARC_M6 TaxID=2928852 RepID=UPI001FB4FEF9|nr:DUF305 domain-containing protein [Rhodococcus sp. ARC_M6]MCJ0902979.1 DUF305 domain-containing protein [Rhodococcus sp. ARC_M6]
MFSVKRSAVRFVPVLAAGALLIAGCSDVGDSASPTSVETSVSAGQFAIPAGVNATDIEFLEGMYPHHSQALDMAKMVEGRTDNAELIALAAKIEAAQGPEMAQMTETLTKWGRPDPSSMSMDGMDHSGHGVGMAEMQGMMSDDDMTALTNATDAEFDKMWLAMMIEHHTGAIAMSETEIADGLDPAAEKMAEEIIAGQQAEITQMEAMLAAK